MANLIEVKVPALGDFSDVEIVEVLVSEGDTVDVESPLLTLESDKASMEVPSSAAGVVRKIEVSVGQRVSEGDIVVRLESGAAALDASPSADEDASPAEEARVFSEFPRPAVPSAETVARETHRTPDPSIPSPAPSRPSTPSSPAATRNGSSASTTSGLIADPKRTPAETPAAPNVHASPSVRRFARELGANLAEVQGSGRMGRVLREDVTAHVKGVLAEPSATKAPAPSPGIPPIPEIDFGEFGEVEVTTLPRIKKISGPFLHRAWLNIPHVTHHDLVDITDLDVFRRELDAKAKQEGYRVTLLSFLLKASAVALREMPDFNASLSTDGESLIRKKYFHIGVAVDTPNGLVVPVLRDVERRGLLDLSTSLGTLSQKARDGKLGPSEMRGASFTISSLGGIGGTSFTPLINAPEVAILGVTRARMEPFWDGSSFVPRLMLPISLSYDHRVVDGAAAARFTARLGELLFDPRRMLL